MFHVKQEQSGRRGGAAGVSVSCLKFTSWCGPHYTSWRATTPKPQGAGTPGSCPDPVGRASRDDWRGSTAVHQCGTSEQGASSLTELLHSKRSVCSAVLALFVSDAGFPSK